GRDSPQRRRQDGSGGGQDIGPPCARRRCAGSGGGRVSGFDLDHAGILVRDLDQAAAQFRRLGFQLTPRGYHTLPAAPGGKRPRVGTGNNCAMLERGYVELIGVTDPKYEGRLRADLEAYQGLHLIAFGTTDAKSTVRAVRAAGL